MIQSCDGVRGLATAVLALVLSCGTEAKSKEIILYSFAGASDGAEPLAGLVADPLGNLYGATYFGGSDGCHRQGCGAIFKVTPGGIETVLHAFKEHSGGRIPYAGLILDDRSNLYGSTSTGGNSGCYGKGCGTVFELAREAPRQCFMPLPARTAHFPEAS